jgi:hypothetical protein
VATLPKDIPTYSMLAMLLIRRLCKHINYPHYEESISWSWETKIDVDNNRLFRVLVFYGDKYKAISSDWLAPGDDADNWAKTEAEDMAAWLLLLKVK